jgi:hypothetical protein
MSLEPELLSVANWWWWHGKCMTRVGWEERGWGRSQLLPQNSITSECKLLYVPMLGLYHFYTTGSKTSNSFILLSSLRQMDGYINPKIDNVNFFLLVATSNLQDVRTLFLLLLLLLLLFTYSSTTRNQQHPPMHHVRWTIWSTLCVCVCVCVGGQGQDTLFSLLFFPHPKAKANHHG